VDKLIVGLGRCVHPPYEFIDCRIVIGKLLNHQDVRVERYEGLNDPGFLAVTSRRAIKATFPGNGEEIPKIERR